MKVWPVPKYHEEAPPVKKPVFIPLVVEFAEFGPILAFRIAGWEGRRTCRP